MIGASRHEHDLVGRVTVVSRRRTAVSALICLMMLAVLPGSAHGADDAAPGSMDPIRVHVGIYVSTIRGVDWEKRTFEVDVYWWLRYLDPADPERARMIEAVEFVNADPGSVAQKELERKTIDTPDGRCTYAHYRTKAVFHFAPDFRRYPFDCQDMPLVLEHETLDTTALVFVDDVESYRRGGRPEHLWGLGESFSLSEFTLKGATRSITTHRYETDFGDLSMPSNSFACSRLTLTVRVARDFMPYLIKIMIPLAICLLLPYLVFFIPSTNLEVASGLTVTSLLACVAIQLTVVPGLPNVGYVVISDKMFYLGYLLSMLAMAQTVWTFKLEKAGNGKAADAMDFAWRFLYPLIFIVGAWVIVTV
jgi:hypothetical protein